MRRKFIRWSKSISWKGRGQLRLSLEERHWWCQFFTFQFPCQHKDRWTWTPTNHTCCLTEARECGQLQYASAPWPGQVSANRGHNIHSQPQAGALAQLLSCYRRETHKHACFPAAFLKPASMPYLVKASRNTSTQGIPLDCQELGIPKPRGKVTIGNMVLGRLPPLALHRQQTEAQLSLSGEKTC